MGQRSQERQRNYQPELGKTPSQGSGNLPAVFESNPRSYQCPSPNQMILMDFSGIVTWREAHERPVTAKSCLRSPGYNTDLFYPVYDISSRLGDPIAWQISFNLSRVFKCKTKQSLRDFRQLFTWQGVKVDPCRVSTNPSSDLYDVRSTVQVCVRGHTC